MFNRFIPFLFLLFTSAATWAGLFDSKPSFLPADQAFQFSHRQNGKQLELNWQIAEGYYLYKKEIQIQPTNAKLGEAIFPTAERYQDEFFGEVEIFHNGLNVAVPLAEQSENAQVSVRYQGCTKGFCYPPETQIIDLAHAESPVQAVVAEQKSANAMPTNPTIQAEQNQLAEQLSQNRFSLVWFFVLGVGLAFTPCVLPMLPLLSAIVIGAKNRPNSARALLLSVSYVQGMALTYTLLGLIVAAIGLPFQVALQSPAVLIGLVVVFSLLALSMFGLFELKLPNRWQQKLNAISQKQQGGSVLSVFVMGMIAGLVASPCTSAPLSGALLYVAQSGDLLTGGLALYLLALGMGVPLILITLFGNRILPKSGDWLLKVKTAFGFVMLALPVFLLSRVYGEYEIYLWSALSSAFLFWLAEQLRNIRLLYFMAIVAGALCLEPISQGIFHGFSPPEESTKTVRFERITNDAQLKFRLANNKSKKVMLDLYADWCVACKEFEKYTFSDPAVQQQLGRMLVLQVDMTANSPENDELMKKLNVLGLPTILFFDENGSELPQKRVTGFMDAEAFLGWLNQL